MFIIITLIVAFIYFTSSWVISYDDKKYYKQPNSAFVRFTKEDISMNIIKTKALEKLDKEDIIQ